MDAKSTVKKMAREQDIHTDSRDCPNDYLLITRGRLCIYKGKIEQLPQ